MRDSNVRRLSRLHRFLFAATGGLIGQRLVNNDMLLLTTTGRRTGHPHTVPLLYLTEGETMVVIASYGGRDRNPDWYLNLNKHPEVLVRTPHQRFPALARTALGNERSSLWQRVVDAYDGYEVYQSRTDRVIPVVLLEPIEL